MNIHNSHIINVIGGVNREPRITIVFPYQAATILTDSCRLFLCVRKERKKLNL